MTHPYTRQFLKFQKNQCARRYDSVEMYEIIMSLSQIFWNVNPLLYKVNLEIPPT